MQILKENLIYIMIVALAFIIGLYFTIPRIPDTFKKLGSNIEKSRLYKDSQEKLSAARQRAELRKTNPDLSEKIVYETPGLGISMEASFAPLFELVINKAKDDMVRIKAIEYKYSPDDDIVVTSNMVGYSVCELQMSLIASYDELQTFLKDILKERYLINLYEVEVMPYAKNKTILLTKLKLRLYAKNAGDAPVDAVGASSDLPPGITPNSPASTTAPANSAATPANTTAAPNSPTATTSPAATSAVTGNAGSRTVRIPVS